MVGVGAMDQDLQNAIDTVDGARQHKCELEGKLKQLNACIAQVSITSEKSRQDIKLHFGNLQSKITSEMHEKTTDLLKEVKRLQEEALKPLQECKQLLEEGIQESDTVIKNGEKLLHSEDDKSSDGKKLNKFTNSTAGLSLDSVPEVPLLVDVASLAFHVKKQNICQEICTSIKSHGEISGRAPAQITELEPLPGGMVVSWDDNDSDETAEWIENGNTVLYKLQFCHGKVNLVYPDASKSYSRPHEMFRDIYIGKNASYKVKKLSPNTAYTFRVSRCLVKGEQQDNTTTLNWSPWSVYQSGVTTLPGYEWAAVNDSEGYSVQDKCRLAIKRSNTLQILHSKTGAYIVGYPITFRVEIEGKSHNTGDGFALVAKSDPTSTSIAKDGTVCVTADGKIFINGTESKTRFCNFCRNSTIRFNTEEIKSEENSSDIIGKKSKSKPSFITLRVTITVMDKEAVFNWRIPTSSISGISSNKLSLSFAAAFKAQGWKFSVI